MATGHQRMLARVLTPARGLSSGLVVEEFGTGVRHEFSWAAMPLDCRRLTTIEAHAVAAAAEEVTAITELRVGEILINTAADAGPEIVRVADLSLTRPAPETVIGRVVFERADTGERYARSGTGLGPHWQRTTLPDTDTSTATASTPTDNDLPPRSTPAEDPDGPAAEEEPAPRVLGEHERVGGRLVSAWKQAGAALFEPALLTRVPDPDRHPDIAAVLARVDSPATAAQIRRAFLDGWHEASAAVTGPVWTTIRATIAEDPDIVAVARDLGRDAESLSGTWEFAELVADKIAGLPDDGLEAVAVRDARYRHGGTAGHRLPRGLLTEIADTATVLARRDWRLFDTEAATAAWRGWAEGQLTADPLIATWLGQRVDDRRAHALDEVVATVLADAPAALADLGTDLTGPDARAWMRADIHQHILPAHTDTGSGDGPPWRETTRGWSPQGTDIELTYREGAWWVGRSGTAKGGQCWGNDHRAAVAAALHAARRRDHIRPEEHAAHARVQAIRAALTDRARPALAAHEVLHALARAPELLHHSATAQAALTVLAEIGDAEPVLLAHARSLGLAPEQLIEALAVELIGELRASHQDSPTATGEGLFDAPVLGADLQPSSPATLVVGDRDGAHILLRAHRDGWTPAPPGEPTPQEMPLTEAITAARRDLARTEEPAAPVASADTAPDPADTDRSPGAPPDTDPDRRSSEPAAVEPSPPEDVDTGTEVRGVPYLGLSELDRAVIADLIENWANLHHNRANPVDIERSAYNLTTGWVMSRLGADYGLRKVVEATAELLAANPRALTGTYAYRSRVLDERAESAAALRARAGELHAAGEHLDALTSLRRAQLTDPFWQAEDGTGYDEIVTAIRDRWHTESPHAAQISDPFTDPWPAHPFARDEDLSRWREWAGARMAAHPWLSSRGQTIADRTMWARLLDEVTDSLPEEFLALNPGSDTTEVMARDWLIADIHHNLALIAAPRTDPVWTQGSRGWAIRSHGVRVDWRTSGWFVHDNSDDSLGQSWGNDHRAAMAQALLLAGYPDLITPDAATAHARVRVLREEYETRAHSLASGNEMLHALARHLRASITGPGKPPRALTAGHGLNWEPLAVSTYREVEEAIAREAPHLVEALTEHAVYTGELWSNALTTTLNELIAEPPTAPLGTDLHPLPDERVLVGDPDAQHIVVSWRLQDRLPGQPRGQTLWADDTGDSGIRTTDLRAAIEQARTVLATSNSTQNDPDTATAINDSPAPLTPEPPSPSQSPDTRHRPDTGTGGGPHPGTDDPDQQPRPARPDSTPAEPAHPAPPSPRTDRTPPAAAIDTDDTAPSEPPLPDPVDPPPAATPDSTIAPPDEPSPHTDSSQAPTAAATTTRSATESATPATPAGPTAGEVAVAGASGTEPAAVAAAARAESHRGVWWPLLVPAPVLVPADLPEARALADTAAGSRWHGEGRFLPGTVNAATARGLRYQLWLSAAPGDRVEDIVLRWRRRQDRWEFEPDTGDPDRGSWATTGRADIAHATAAMSRPNTALAPQAGPMLDEVVAKVLALDSLQRRGLDTYDTYRNRVGATVAVALDAAITDLLTDHPDPGTAAGSVRVRTGLGLIENAWARRELAAAITLRAWIGHDFSPGELVRIRCAVEDHTHSFVQPRIGIGEEGAVRYTAETYLDRHFDTTVRAPLWRAVAAHVARHRDEVLASSPEQLTARAHARAATTTHLHEQAVTALLDADPAHAHRLLDAADHLDPDSAETARLRRITADHYADDIDDGQVQASVAAIAAAAAVLGWRHHRLASPGHASVSVLRWQDSDLSRYALRLVFDPSHDGPVHNETASGVSRLGGKHAAPLNIRDGALSLSRARRIIAVLCGPPITETTPTPDPVTLSSDQRALLGALLGDETVGVLAAALADPDAALAAVFTDRPLPAPGPHAFPHRPEWATGARLVADTHALRLLVHDSECARVSAEELAGFAAHLPADTRTHLDRYGAPRRLRQLLAHDVLALGDLPPAPGSDTTAATATPEPTIAQHDRSPEDRSLHDAVAEVVPEAGEPVAVDWARVVEEIAGDEAVRAVIRRHPYPPHHYSSHTRVNGVIRARLDLLAQRGPGYRAVIAAEYQTRSAHIDTIASEIAAATLATRDQWWPCPIGEPALLTRWREWAAAALSADPIIAAWGGHPLNSHRALTLDHCTDLLLARLGDQLPELGIDPADPDTRAWLAADIRLTVQPGLPRPDHDDPGLWGETDFGFHPPVLTASGERSTRIRVSGGGSLSRDGGESSEDWGSDYHAAMVEALRAAGREDPVSDHARHVHAQVSALRTELATAARAALAADVRVQAAADSDRLWAYLDHNRIAHSAMWSDLMTDAVDEFVAHLAVTDPALVMATQRLGLKIRRYLHTEVGGPLLRDLRRPTRSGRRPDDTPAPAGYTVTIGSAEAAHPVLSVHHDSFTGAEGQIEISALARAIAEARDQLTGTPADRRPRQTHPAAVTLLKVARVPAHLADLIERAEQAGWAPRTRYLRVEDRPTFELTLAATTESGTWDLVLSFDDPVYGGYRHNQQRSTARWQRPGHAAESFPPHFELIEALVRARTGPAITWTPTVLDPGTPTRPATARAAIDQPSTGPAPSRDTDGVPVIADEHSLLRAAARGLLRTAEPGTLTRPGIGPADAAVLARADQRVIEDLIGRGLLAHDPDTGALNDTPGARTRPDTAHPEHGEPAVGDRVLDMRTGATGIVCELFDIDDAATWAQVLDTDPDADVHTADRAELALLESGALSPAHAHALYTSTLGIEPATPTTPPAPDLGNTAGIDTGDTLAHADTTPDHREPAPTAEDTVSAHRDSNTGAAIEVEPSPTPPPSQPAHPQPVTEGKAEPESSTAADPLTARSAPTAAEATPDAAAAAVPATHLPSAPALVGGMAGLVMPGHRLPQVENPPPNWPMLAAPQDLLKLTALARTRGWQAYADPRGYSREQRPPHWWGKLLARTAQGMRIITLQYDLQPDDTYRYSPDNSYVTDQPFTRDNTYYGWKPVEPGQLIHHRPVLPTAEPVSLRAPDINDLAHEIWESGRTRIHHQPDTTPAGDTAPSDEQRAALLDVLTGRALTDPALTGDPADPTRTPTRTTEFVQRVLQAIIDAPVTAMPGEASATAEQVAAGLLADRDAIGQIATDLAAKLSATSVVTDRDRLLAAAVADCEDTAARRAIELGLDLALEHISVHDRSGLDPVYRIESGGRAYLSTVSRAQGVHSLWIADEHSYGWSQNPRGPHIGWPTGSTAITTLVRAHARTAAEDATIYDDIRTKGRLQRQLDAGKGPVTEPPAPESADDTAGSEAARVVPPRFPVPELMELAQRCGWAVNTYDNDNGVLIHTRALLDGDRWSITVQWPHHTPGSATPSSQVTRIGELHTSHDEPDLALLIRLLGSAEHTFDAGNHFARAHAAAVEALAQRRADPARRGHHLDDAVIAVRRAEVLCRYADMEADNPGDLRAADRGEVERAEAGLAEAEQIAAWRTRILAAIAGTEPGEEIGPVDVVLDNTLDLTLHQLTSPDPATDLGASALMVLLRSRFLMPTRLDAVWTELRTARTQSSPPAPAQETTPAPDDVVASAQDIDTPSEQDAVPPTRDDTETGDTTASATASARSGTAEAATPLDRSPSPVSSRASKSRRLSEDQRLVLYAFGPFRIGEVLRSQDPGAAVARLMSSQRGGTLPASVLDLRPHWHGLMYQALAGRLRLDPLGEPLPDDAAAATVTKAALLRFAASLDTAARDRLAGPDRDAALREVLGIDTIAATPPGQPTPESTDSEPATPSTEPAPVPDTPHAAAVAESGARAWPVALPEDVRLLLYTLGVDRVAVALGPTPIPTIRAMLYSTNTGGGMHRRVLAVRPHWRGLYYEAHDSEIRLRSMRDSEIAPDAAVTVLRVSTFQELAAALDQPTREHLTDTTVPAAERDQALRRALGIDAITATPPQSDTPLPDHDIAVRPPEATTPATQPVTGEPASPVAPVEVEPLDIGALSEDQRLLIYARARDLKVAIRSASNREAARVRTPGTLSADQRIMLYAVDPRKLAAALGERGGSHLTRLCNSWRASSLPTSVLGLRPGWAGWGGRAVAGEIGLAPHWVPVGDQQLWVSLTRKAIAAFARTLDSDLRERLSNADAATADDLVRNALGIDLMTATDDSPFEDVGSRSDPSRWITAVFGSSAPSTPNATVLAHRPSWQHMLAETTATGTLRLRPPEDTTPGPHPPEVTVTAAELARLAYALPAAQRALIASPEVPDTVRDEILRQALAITTVAPAATSTPAHPERRAPAPAPEAATRAEAEAPDTERVHTPAPTEPDLRTDTSTIDANVETAGMPVHPGLWEALTHELAANARRFDTEDDGPSAERRELTYHHAVLDRISAELAVVDEPVERDILNGQQRRARTRADAAARAVATYDALETALAPLWRDLDTSTSEQLSELVYDCAAIAREGGDPSSALDRELGRLDVLGLDRDAVVQTVVAAASDWLEPERPAPQVDVRRWTIPIPATRRAERGKAALAQWLCDARDQTGDPQQKAALTLAADALTSTAWARHGGVATQARELAEVDAATLTASGNDRAWVDESVAVIAGLAVELNRIGYGDTQIAVFRGAAPSLGRYLHDYVTAYTTARAQHQPTPAPATAAVPGSRDETAEPLGQAVASRVKAAARAYGYQAQASWTDDTDTGSHYRLRAEHPDQPGQGFELMWRVPFDGRHRVALPALSVNRIPPDPSDPHRWAGLPATVFAALRDRSAPPISAPPTVEQAHDTAAYAAETAMLARGLCLSIDGVTDVELRAAQAESSAADLALEATVAGEPDHDRWRNRQRRIRARVAALSRDTVRQQRVRELLAEDSLSLGRLDEAHARALLDAVFAAAEASHHGDQSSAGPRWERVDELLDAADALTADQRHAWHTHTQIWRTPTELTLPPSEDAASATPPRPDSQAESPADPGPVSPPFTPAQSAPVDAAVGPGSVEVSPAVAIEGDTFAPTAQQQAVYDHVLAGLDVKVQAGAGAGKTSTLEGLARRLAVQDPATRILYIAFGKSVQIEAAARMPANVEARTGHSIAYQWAPKYLQQRTRDDKALRKHDQVARHLGITRTGAGSLSVTEMAMAATRTVETYANSAEDRIGAQAPARTDA